MVDEVIDLVEGLGSREVEALLGEPDWREPTRLTYRLRACPGSFVPVLEIYLEDDVVTDARRRDLD
jgi:hypothetical protein